MNGLQWRKGIRVSHRFSGIATARGKRYCDVHSAVFGGLFHGGGTTEDNQIGETDFFVESAADILEHSQHLLKPLRLVALPVFLRCQANARAVGPAAIV